MTEGFSSKSLKRSYDFIVVGDKNPADAVVKVCSLEGKSVLHVVHPHMVEFKVLGTHLCSVSGKTISTTRIFWCVDLERKKGIFSQTDKKRVLKKSTLCIAADLSDLRTVAMDAQEGIKTSILTHVPSPFADFDTSIAEALLRDLKNKNIRLYATTEVLRVYKDGEYWVTQAQQGDIPHKFRTESVVEYSEYEEPDYRTVKLLNRPYDIDELTRLLSKKIPKTDDIRWKELAYVQPIVQVGLTEQEAVKRYLPYIKSVETISTPDGVSWVKVLAHANKKILGAAIWHQKSSDIGYEIFRAIHHKQKTDALLKTLRLDRPGMDLLASALREVL